jgi:thioredoxin-like negative regulator of GroEL
MTMRYATSVDELRELISKCDRPICVGVYADWCPASSQAKPVFERLGCEMSDTVAFCKVLTDMSPSVADALGVEAIPTLYLFAAGSLVATLRGAAPEQAVRAWLVSALEAAEVPSASTG